MAVIRKKRRNPKNENSTLKPILVIEDQRSLGQMLQGLLSSRWECEVHLASTLADAKSLLAKGNQYMLAVTDLNLPDAKDDETLVMLHEFELPAVVLTGQLDDALRETIIETGAVDYVFKHSSNALNYVVELVGRFIKNKTTKALVVDDSNAIRMLLKHRLEYNGFNVITAENGKDGLDKLLKNRDIKLMLTDYNMPEINGVELTIEARKRFGKEKLAIIGMSDAGSSTTAHFLKNGANDFIHKPFHFEEITTRINQNLDMLDLLAENHRAANYDFLTQLFNRRAFFNIGQQSVEEAIVKKKPVIAAMVDIDHFKKINDTYGHDSGDVVLMEFSQVLQKHFRDQVVARLGGEEFTIVMTGIPSSLALKRLEHFRSTIEEMIFDEEDTPIKATASVGYVFTMDKDDLDELLLAADGKLYEAKNTGRNRVVG